MRTVKEFFRHHHLLGFVLSLAAGLTLAFAVGAVASSTGSGGASAERSLAKAEAARDALPDSSVMAIFARPATATDALPTAAENVVHQFSTAPVPDAVNPGIADLANSRRALTGAGGEDASLYLVPTAKGSLCMVWVPDIGGGCTQGFQPGTNAVVVRNSLNGVIHVWGIFRSNVKGVSAVVNGQAQPLTLGESSFFYEGDALPSNLILNLANGSTENVVVAAIPTLK
jgi:hypothetical protein